MQLKCKKCGYEWITKEDRMPVACPQCRVRLQYGKWKIEEVKRQ